MIMKLGMHNIQSKGMKHMKEENYQGRLTAPTPYFILFFILSYDHET